MDRKNIGILLLGSNAWIGGLYYVLNIIRSMNALDDERKPHIYVFTGNKTASAHLDHIDYPYFTEVQYNRNFLQKIYFSLLAKLTKKDLRLGRFCKQYNLAAVYPYNYAYTVPTKAKIIAWFPDFQHKYLPHLFSKADIQSRDHYLDRMQEHVHHLVFSSNDSLSHFKQFYPNSKLNLYTLPFVSNVETHSQALRQEVRLKYDLSSGSFFIVSNQFWEHKNHFVVLRAVKELKTNGQDVTVLFTGKEEDYRNPEYFPQIKKFIQENHLQNEIRMLGFIPRTDQLCLMQEAIAIIQPSKFEGWGTVVEDAKTLNKQTIVSDIPIHREQLGENAYYFAEDDHHALAELMNKMDSGLLKEKHHYTPVAKRRSAFANAFIHILLDD